MKRETSHSRRTVWILAGLLVLVVAGGVWVTLATRNVPGRAPAAVLPPLQPGEVRAAEFGRLYPLQYQTYLRTGDESNEPSRYGGSVPRDKLEELPYLNTLFAGYGFSREYLEDRGHVYALQDVNQTGRNPTTLNCMHCKSPQVPAAIDRYGKAFFTLAFQEYSPEFTESVGCADCHDPQTMKLQVSRPALWEALAHQGKTPENVTHQEMRTLVCAQCHTEYYFPAPTREVVYPWGPGGFEAEGAYAYYQQIAFADWNHPQTDAPLLKAQHPEFEMFMGSTHQAAGLACADCHMPYTVQGSQKFTSHWVTSPLKHMEESCGTCHRQTAEELRERVFYTQDRTKRLLDQAATVLVEAIELIEATRDRLPADALARAQALHRESQWMIDWVAAENSMGFHNPQKALDTLARGLDLAYQARETVLRALGGTGIAGAALPVTPGS